MKRSYHICLSADDEACCRTEEDYNYCFNSLALAIARTDSSLLVDAIMSNHIHECIRTTCPQEFITMHRYTYTRYFNSKYQRKGSLWERKPFIIELEGLYHTMAALSYALRNPVHHGITQTPFAYKHSSARTIFKDNLGYTTDSERLPDNGMYRFLPQHTKCPKGYKMDKNGLILREDVVDTADIQHMFGTPRAYLYYMNRLSGEEWRREQEKDQSNSAPITLDSIETGVGYQSILQMMDFEHGRHDYKAMDDIKVCELIDFNILPEMGKTSVYQLSTKEKAAIGNWLFQEHKLPKAQIIRCLAMNY